MSQSNARQRYFQLMEWLEVRKQKSKNTSSPSRTRAFSKADTYNKSR